MNTSKCPKCESSTFENVTEMVTGYNYQLNFIRCAKCKTVISILENYNIGALLHGLAEKLNINLYDEN